MTGGTTTWAVATMVATAVSLKPRLEDYIEIQVTSVCRTRTVLIPVGSGSSSMEEGTVSEQRRASLISLLLAGPCRKAPATDQFCADHYWYGPNKCGKEYCR